VSEEKRICSIQELDFTPQGEVFPSPAEWRDHFIYFLLIDRFDDGKERPPYDGSREERRWDDARGQAYQGGTFKGVTARLPYIRNLGATAVWISPVLKNRFEGVGHMYLEGYAVQDFLAVEPRMGTLGDLQELVRVAHALDMRVILDIIINHTGDNWAYKEGNSPRYRSDGTRFEFGHWRSEHGDEFGPDDAVWPAELQSPECYKRRGEIVNWNDLTESRDGDFSCLKELDFGNPIVRETLEAAYKYWIAATDIDGYRIDTVKHVEDTATATFCTAIKEYAASIGKHNFLIFGEVVAGDDVLHTYVGPRTQSESKLLGLDACLDFPLYFVLEEVIKGFVSPHLLRERYRRLRELYANSDASEYFVTFIDNHDQIIRPYKRFLHQVPDDRQALLAIAYLLTTPGIPSIYYGTEQSFDGGAPPGPYRDVFVRECMFGGSWGAFGTHGMHFFNEHHPLYMSIAAIAHVRKEQPALRYGRFYFREVSEDSYNFAYPALGWGMLAYSRILDDREVLVVLNLRDTEYGNYVTVDMTLSEPGTLMENLLNPNQTALVEMRAGRACISVTVPAHSVALYARKKA
jgi:glycosidase